MAGRPSLPAPTALSVAIRGRRLGETQRDIAPVVGVNRSTLARLERGAHQPGAETALRLARWLGWSVERVLEAAKAPAELA